MTTGLVMTMLPLGLILSVCVLLYITEKNDREYEKRVLEERLERMEKTFLGERTECIRLQNELAATRRTIEELRGNESHTVATLESLLTRLKGEEESEEAE
jgi:hypothetical protein